MNYRTDSPKIESPDLPNLAPRTLNMGGYAHRDKYTASGPGSNSARAGDEHAGIDPEAGASGPGLSKGHICPLEDKPLLAWLNHAINHEPIHKETVMIGGVEYKREVKITVDNRMLWEGRQKAKLITYEGGTLVEFRRDRYYTTTTKKRGAVRGAIRGYSKKSRRRFMKMMGRIRWDDVGMGSMITLTYPAEWPGDPKKWKRDLHTWLKRLERIIGKKCLFWKLEPQKRGAPHFHILIFDGWMINAEWVSESWYEVVGSGDERHLKAGTNVSFIQSWNGVMAYASKYIAKLTELPEAWVSPGRYWGIRNRDIAPWATQGITNIPDWVAVELMRAALKLHGKKGRHPRDDYHFTKTPDTWIRYAEYLDTA